MIRKRKLDHFWKSNSRMSQPSLSLLLCRLQMWSQLRSLNLRHRPQKMLSNLPTRVRANRRKSKSLKAKTRRILQKSTTRSNKLLPLKRRPVQPILLQKSLRPSSKMWQLRWLKLRLSNQKRRLHLNKNKPARKHLLKVNTGWNKRQRSLCNQSQKLWAKLLQYHNNSSKSPLDSSLRQFPWCLVSIQCKYNQNYWHIWLQSNNKRTHRISSLCSSNKSSTILCS
jgi:hypothetical protein